MGKTVVLFGSPRKNGNTNKILLNILEKSEDEVVFINAYEKNISSCIDCRYCYKEGKCCLNDDMQSIYKLLEDCEKLIIAAPMYFCSVPAPLKAIIDRLQVYWSRKFILHLDNSNIKPKQAILIITAGSNTEKFYFIEDMMKHVFSLLRVENCQNVFVGNLDNRELSKQELQGFNIET